MGDAANPAIVNGIPRILADFSVCPVLMCPVPYSHGLMLGSSCDEAAISQHDKFPSYLLPHSLVEIVNFTEHESEPGIAMTCVMVKERCIYQHSLLKNEPALGKSK